MPCVKFDPNIDIPDLSGQVFIYLAARSQEKAQAAIEELQKEASRELPPIVFLNLDLSSFESIKSAAATINREESRLDLLINNAGIMMTQEALTADGYEIQFGTNVMGPALFTLLLLPLLRHTSTQHPQTRVVNLASASETRAPADIYDFIALKTTMSDKHTTVRYTTSKIADIHFTSALARRISDVRFVSVHPGMVATNLHHAADGIFLKAFLNVAGILATPVAKGAHSQLWAAVSPDAKHGGYYGPVGVPAGTKAALSVEKSEELWSWMREELREHVDMPVELLSYVVRRHFHELGSLDVFANNSATVIFMQRGQTSVH